MKHKLRYRQVHLDFHTSPDIDGIGAAFDKTQFQNALKTGHVDSITVFSKCHHGYSYHPTEVGKMHPNLSFDLLDAEIDACREIGVKAPIYLSAGLDHYVADLHPEWRFVKENGDCTGWANGGLNPGFHKMCFNTGYLDYLCMQIEEIVRRYPDADGIFLDIINKAQCFCPSCIASMRERGLNPENCGDRDKFAQEVLENYYKRTTDAARVVNPDMPIFHNSGNVAPGNRLILNNYFSHFELESLPTGGWGYDHFPLSAKYVEQLGLDFLGMTGKFNASWGEFGGFKHPNALRYECAAMLAYGAKCSIGDQAHPSMRMDESTYTVVGEAFADVEKKEPWCDDTFNHAEIGLLLAESVRDSVHEAKLADIGASRVLLEEHFLFDALDLESDFSKYRLLILPDHVTVDDELKAKLDTYLAAGGKLIFSGNSGFGPGNKDDFRFDAGASIGDVSPFYPDYIMPVEGFRAYYMKTPQVMYSHSRRVKITDGESLGDVYDSYFNRTFNHFCSHKHTPNKMEASGFVCGSVKGGVCYLAHNVFMQYQAHGGVIYRKFIAAAIRRMLGSEAVIFGNLPSSARVSLRGQPLMNRDVLHLLYAEKMLRGGYSASDAFVTGGPSPIEIIDDIMPIRDVSVRMKVSKPVKAVLLAPQGNPLEFKSEEGAISFTVSEIECHQMVEIDY